MRLSATSRRSRWTSCPDKGRKRSMKKVIMVLAIATGAVVLRTVVAVLTYNAFIDAQDR